MNIHKVIESVKQDKNKIYIRKKNDLLGYLIPVSYEDYHNYYLIKKLFDWRKKNINFFFKRENVNIKNIKNNLLKEYIRNNKKIFFLIYDEKNNLIGHIGLTRISKLSATLDNLIRGEKGGGKDFIINVEKKLINWCFYKLNLNSIYGTLLSNNYIMMEIHKKIGFKITKQRHLFEKKFGKNIILLNSNKKVSNTNIKKTYIKISR